MVVMKVHLRPCGFSDGKSKDFDLSISAEANVKEIVSLYSLITRDERTNKSILHYLVVI